MNLNDLMEVWRSQEASPLHGVNETLLRLALRQDEAKLQARRRRERWMTYFWSAGIVAGMAFFLAIMIYPYDDDVLLALLYCYKSRNSAGKRIAFTLYGLKPTSLSPRAK